MSSQKQRAGGPMGGDCSPAVTEPRKQAAAFCKYALDVLLITLTLPVWAPIMVVIALWIKTVSRGAALYRQERVGQNGGTFTLLKFRSMEENVETGSHQRHLEALMRSNNPMTKLDTIGDNRLVPGGRLLRASGMDELPQLFNVLCGQMSLVGPRPCTPYEYERYEAWQKCRVQVKPGLTGYWQVNGKNRTTFTEMIEMDLYYVRNQSLWLDLKIVAKTLQTIVGQLLETRGEWRGQKDPS